MSPKPRSADKRQAILDAALALFVERGFHGTAVPQVAERAGVGAGTIYRYFDSKEALVNELFRQTKSALAECMFEGFEPSMSAREGFRWFWSRMTDYVLKKPDAFAFLELHQHSSYLDEASRQVEEQVLTFVLEFIRSAQQRDEIRPIDPMVLIGVVWGSFVGLVRLSWQGKLDLDAAKLAEAEQSVWEAIRS